MKKSIFAKLSVGAALAAAIGFVPTAQAQTQGDQTQVEPAVTLIMPFDVTENHASFQLVSRIAGETSGPVATHWSYWSESCDHLADVFICLTPKDTIVVDPTALQGQVQIGGTNINTGPVVNLAGTRGFVTVTAFDFLEGSQACVVADPSAASSEPSLVGSWVVANTVSNASFGNNAIGLFDAATLPDASVFGDPTSPSDPQGLFIQTFDPTSLQDSGVFLIGVAVESGSGSFALSEVGPIPLTHSSGHAAVCSAEFCDNAENCTSINDIDIDCATALPIANNDALGNDPNSIIPSFVAAETSGFVRLTNCFVGGSAGDQGIASGVGVDDKAAFIFAFHGMAVGPYGTAVSGKYTLL